MNKNHTILLKQQTKRVYGANETLTATTSSRMQRSKTAGSGLGLDPARAMMLVEVISAPPVCSPRSSSKKVADVRPVSRKCKKYESSARRQRMKLPPQQGGRTVETSSSRNMLR